MYGNTLRYHRFINLRNVLLVTLLLLAAAVQVRAEEWPGWRGPTGLGYTTQKDLPLTWNGKTGENILWKAELHGGRKRNPEFASPGWSSPIVWGDRVILTTAIWPADVPEKERRATIGEHHVLCYRATDGEQLWDTIVPPGKRVVNNFYQMYTVPTPVTDGKQVYEKRAERITPSASPVTSADGRIYFASSGKTYVLQAGPEYKELAVNDLDDHPDYTSAAVSDGRIFIKGKSYLWCIGKK